MDKKDQALAEFTASRRNLLGAIDGLSIQEMSMSNMVGEWSIIDLLGHITSWDEACLKLVRPIVESGEFQPSSIKSVQQYNEEQTAAKRDLPPRVILDELISVREEFIEALSELPDKAWEDVYPWPWGEVCPVHAMVSGLADHENEHAGEIKEAFRRFHGFQSA